MGFFVVFTAVICLIYLYSGWRVIPILLPGRPGLLAWSAVAVSMFLPSLYFVLRFNRLGGPLTDVIAPWGYPVLGFMTLIFCCLVLRDLFLGVRTLLKRMPLLFQTRGRDRERALNPGRREFVLRATNAGILILGASASGYGYHAATREPCLIDVTVPLPNLPPELEGLTMVQFTDLHVGPTIKRPFVETVVKRIQEADPRIIVCTGDLVDGPVSLLKSELEPLKDLSAPMGKYFVTGNHEYYSGVIPWLRELESLGFDVLINENRILGQKDRGILLAGVTDYTAGRMLREHRSDPLAARGTPDREMPSILLAHQPKSIDAASKAGFDLQISGHTHGGQYIPGNLLARLDQPFIAGRYTVDSTLLYVSRGTGYWGPPLRLGTRSEVTRFTLTGRGGSGVWSGTAQAT